MENIELKPISILDIEWLDKTEYKSLSTEKRLMLVDDSERRLCRDEFFCFFLVKVDENVVGVINIQGHGKDVVSVAPEIFEEYRGKGFAYKGLSLAYIFAKDKGFKELTAGIREQNFASQKLHKKLGFKFVKNSISRNGNVLKIYSKQL